MRQSRSLKWLFYALLAVFWWGLFGFFSKLGAMSLSPRQIQIFFTVGMMPIVIGALLRLNWAVETDRVGATYGILNGVLTGLGLLAYYAAMERGKASIVGPVTSLFPLLTVIMALFLLRERINKVQIVGVSLALISIFILSL